LQFVTPAEQFHLSQFPNQRTLLWSTLSQPVSARNMKLLVLSLGLFALPSATHGFAEWNPVVQCSTVMTNAPFEVCATSYLETPSPGLMVDDKVVFDEKYRDEYSIVTGLEEGTDVSCLPDAEKFNSGIKVTLQRDLEDNCKVTISSNGHDSVCSSCSYCGDQRYTVDCSAVDNGRSVTCESTGPGIVFFPLEASALTQAKVPTKPLVAAPAKKVPALPDTCSSWSRPPLQDATRTFRATVVREIRPGLYVINVGRYFKGCDIKDHDRVLVALGAKQPLSLTKGMSYLFVGLPMEEPLRPLTQEEKAMLGNRSKVKLAVRLGVSNQPFAWQCVDPMVMATLRADKKACPKTN
jgi:hypothetical protein